MPVHFDWRSLQQYALPALGIVSLLMSAIIADAGRNWGRVTHPRIEVDPPDANVIFKVVDQAGNAPCSLGSSYNKSPYHRFKYNNQDGTLPVKAEPGTTTTRIFSCSPAQDGVFDTMEVAAVAHRPVC